MEAIGIISSRYAKDVNPWLDEQLHRETGLKIDRRDILRVCKVEDLSLTAACAFDYIVFGLMKGDKMRAAIKLPVLPETIVVMVDNVM